MFWNETCSAMRKKIERKWKERTRSYKLWKLWKLRPCNWRCSSIVEANKLKLELRGKESFSTFYLKTYELKAEKFQKFHNFEALFASEECQNMNSLGLQNLSLKERNISADAFVSLPTGHKFEKRGRFPTDLISELQLLIIIVSGNSSAFATMNRKRGRI